jgi:hypothetical protein
MSFIAHAVRVGRGACSAGETSVERGLHIASRRNPGVKRRTIGIDVYPLGLRIAAVTLPARTGFTRTGIVVAGVLYIARRRVPRINHYPYRLTFFGATVAQWRAIPIKLESGRD